MTDVMATVRELQARGAVRVRVRSADGSEIEAVFGALPVELPTQRTLTDEERKAEEDRILFHSEGGP